jgi:Flp pilus assembly protein TadD
VRRLASQIGDFDFAERAEELTLRALKLQRRGELRRASLTMREATSLDESNAARWMLFAQMLIRLGQRDDAERAMKQSLFLRERRGEKVKANVIRRLLLNLAGCSGR